MRNGTRYHGNPAADGEAAARRDAHRASGECPKCEAPNVAVFHNGHPCPKATAPTPIATERYDDHRADVLEKLDDLVDAVDVHGRRQDLRPSDWGFVGDLAHVDNLLGEILSFFRSGAPAPVAPEPVKTYAGPEGRRYTVPE